MTNPGTSPQLDVYDIAYLAAGPDRVVDTALVALVETGRVRVQPPGQLAVAELARRHPVEAAVLDAVGTRGHRSVDVVRWRLADDDRVFAIGRRLVSAGLLSRWAPRPSPDGPPPGTDRGGPAGAAGPRGRPTARPRLGRRHVGPR